MLTYITSVKENGVLREAFILSNWGLWDKVVGNVGKMEAQMYHVLLLPTSRLALHVGQVVGCKRCWTDCILSKYLSSARPTSTVPEVPLDP